MLPVNDPRFNTKNKTRHNYLIEMQERRAHIQNLKSIINGKKKKTEYNKVNWYKQNNLTSNNQND